MGHLTKYFFDENQRLISVKKYEEGVKLACAESYVWGANDTPNSTYLLAKTGGISEDGMGSFARTYAYDSYGNVTVDRLFANLTGENPVPPQLNTSSLLCENGCEYYQKVYRYSEDERNLLLEETDGRQTVLYSYKPNTNLVTAKYCVFEGKSYQRRFYFYDDHGLLLKEILDDGIAYNCDDLSQVSERYITHYSPRLSYPVGLPERVEEKYVDYLNGGEERLLRLKLNHYDEWGRLKEQLHYGSNGEYLYTLGWDYDPHNNLTKEVDALGKVTLRTYDDNDNLIAETSPNGLIKHFEYDRMNRLVKEDVFADGICLTTRHHYDYLGNRILTQDPYGNQTHFEYDSFGRVIKMTGPTILTAHGVETPTVCKSYDIQGNVTEIRDAKNQLTKTSYTIRNQPVLWEYPDGSSEKKVYHTDGRLSHSVAKNGATTYYTGYDFANRPIRQETLAPNGERLVTSQNYNTFHLLAEADPSNTIPITPITPMVSCALNLKDTA